MTERNLHDEMIGAIDSYMDDIHTAMPATVVSYDPIKKTVNVQPDIMRKLSGDESLALPHIVGCPVMFPGSANCIIQFPLSAGDSGLVVFSEMSLEAWYRLSQRPCDNGGDDRFYSLTDGFFIPGGFSPVKPGKVGSGSGLEIIYKGAKIQCDDSGNVNINGTSKTFVTYDALNTALQQMVSAANLLFLTAATGGVKSGGLTLDISGSKTTTVKTGG